MTTTSTDQTVTFTISGTAYWAACDPRASEVPREEDWPVPTIKRRGKGQSVTYTATRVQGEQIASHLEEVGSSLMYGDAETRVEGRALLLAAERVRSALAVEDVVPSPEFPPGTPEYATYAAELTLRLRRWAVQETPDSTPRPVELVNDDGGHLEEVFRHLGSLEDLDVLVEGRRLDTRWGLSPVMTYQNGTVAIRTRARTTSGTHTIYVRPGDTVLATTEGGREG